MTFANRHVMNTSHTDKQPWRNEMVDRSNYIDVGLTRDLEWLNVDRKLLEDRMEGGRRESRRAGRRDIRSM